MKNWSNFNNRLDGEDFDKLISKPKVSLQFILTIILLTFVTATMVMVFLLFMQNLKGSSVPVLSQPVSPTMTEELPTSNVIQITNTYTPSPTATLTLTPTIISPTALSDTDGDGLDDLDEILLGTDPLKSNSYSVSKSATIFRQWQNINTQIGIVNQGIFVFVNPSQKQNYTVDGRSYDAFDVYLSAFINSDQIEENDQLKIMPEESLFDLSDHLKNIGTIKREMICVKGIGLLKPFKSTEEMCFYKKNDNGGYDIIIEAGISKDILKCDNDCDMGIPAEISSTTPPSTVTPSPTSSSLEPTIQTGSEN